MEILERAPRSRRATKIALPLIALLGSACIVLEQLGWEPRITLEQGLPKTVEYFKKLLESSPA